MSNFSYIAPYAQYFTRPVPQVMHDFETYAYLLRKWQRVQNLVSYETLDDLWVRHFADSLQILRLLIPDDQDFMDIGSGGGFPALPLAIALKGRNCHFTLIEPISRKVSFLRTIVRELGLPVTVKGQRSDEIVSRGTSCADVITSRALASLPVLVEWMLPFWSSNTRAILHKGREHVKELSRTVSSWNFDVLIDKSDTDASGVLLTIKNLRSKTKS